MASFVSGNPGSGKCTLALELGRRGYRALDADLVPGLAARLNVDGAVVGDGSLEPTRELLATCFWGWSGSRLDNVLDELGSDGILLGIAVNQWEFIERFDRLVLLELDQETQRRRASSRDRLFRQQIEDGLPVFRAQMLAHGATRVDAAQAAPDVAAAVIKALAMQRPSRLPSERPPRPSRQ